MKKIYLRILQPVSYGFISFTCVLVSDSEVSKRALAAHGVDRQGMEAVAYGRVVMVTLEMLLQRHQIVVPLLLHVLTKQAHVSYLASGAWFTKPSYFMFKLKGFCCYYIGVKKIWFESKTIFMYQNATN